jgi:hypothetical protein
MPMMIETGQDVIVGGAIRSKYCVAREQGGIKMAVITDTNNHLRVPPWTDVRLKGLFPHGEVSVVSTQGTVHMG